MNDVQTYNEVDYNIQTSFRVENDHGYDPNQNEEIVNDTLEDGIERHQ